MRTLGILLFLFGACSLVHFVHNAEYITNYPNMPTSWSRNDVYAGMNATILLEVTAAALVLVEVMRQLASATARGRSS